MSGGVVADLRAMGLANKDAEHSVSRFRGIFDSMAPWLPAGPVAHFLDIGCGLGGVAMYVSRHYPGATAHLIDAERPGAKWVSYRSDGAPWADVNIAVRLFAKHCPGRGVCAWPPRQDIDLPPCELIYSNCSWGHHYPIEAYLELVRRSLKKGGVLIVDLRIGDVGEHGLEVLGRHFQYAATAYTGKKYNRTVWRA